jgi:hypothetical protein
MTLGIARATPSNPSPQTAYSRPCRETHALALSIAAGVSFGQILNARIGISTRRFARS